MKHVVAFVLALSASALPGWSVTTITATNRYAYGGNLGWIGWRGNTNNGAVIGEYVCSGFVYSANAGWIHLGSNAPANEIRYQNNSALDYGVNHDGFGNLTGMAYSANCGWVSLSNSFAHVQTATVVAGTTLAFMAVTYLLIPLIFRRELVLAKWAKVQPYLFGIGAGGISVFMMGAGTLGIPRRVWDITGADAVISHDYQAAASQMKG